jgi:cysteine desulfurase
MPFLGQYENFVNCRTNVEERVLKSVLPFITQRECEEIDSGKHSRKIKHAVDTASSKLLFCSGIDGSVVFTHGRACSNSMIIKGFPKLGRGIIYSVLESESLIGAIRKENISAYPLGLTPEGLVDLSRLRELLETKNIGLVCISAINEITGKVQPLPEIHDICKKKGCFFYTDASQYLGKIDAPIRADYAGITADSIYGMGGIGAIVVSREAPALIPIIEGSDYIPPYLKIAFGQATDYIGENYAKVKELKTFRDVIIHRMKQYESMSVNTDFDSCGFYLSFSVKEDARLIVALMEKEYGINIMKESGKGISVLKSMGVDPVLADNSMRVVMSKFTSKKNLHSFPHMIAACLVKAKAWGEC